MPSFFRLLVQTQQLQQITRILNDIYYCLLSTEYKLTNNCHYLPVSSDHFVVLEYLVLTAQKILIYYLPVFVLLKILNSKFEPCKEKGMEGNLWKVKL
jgi:hypothetical protein